ncbi:hypothetical protein T492DRAFT_376794 [Pavlovales sp. CCMP2436]|nr:hypothetical protein T492DRAFT_376794 [Pavlovales sp. CCMP2436]
MSDNMKPPKAEPRMSTTAAGGEKARATGLREMLIGYDAANAAEDAEDDALDGHLAAWRTSSFEAKAVHPAKSLLDAAAGSRGVAAGRGGNTAGRLDLSARGLSELHPHNLHGLSYVLELSLVGNSLASLPDSLAAALPSLSVLNLGANRLSQLPDLRTLPLVHVGLRYVLAFTELESKAVRSLGG